MTRTSVRPRAVFVCTECDSQAPKWLGRCPECGAWSSLVEERPSGPGPAAVAAEVRPLAEVDAMPAASVPSGVAELDRVLGGGLVPGSVTLLGGEPGIGKSTLLLQALGRLAAGGRRCLLVSAEESAEQVRLRAGRLDALDPNLLVVAETSLPAVCERIAQVGPDVVAVDSIQTVLDPDVGGVPGSVSQVRECAHRLVRLAKERCVTTLLVGHVTKEGALAGPRALEHVVDTVLSFEGDRHHELRTLHALKHRFGSTHELGVFRMDEAGLADVADPSALLLGDRREGIAGSVVTATVDGTRPLLVEAQALVAPAGCPTAPRRGSQGFDARRLELLIAVLAARAGRALGDHDVYVSAVGGLRLGDPGADLAVALAIASARSGLAVPAGVVAVGEIGLGGEVRRVPQLTRRLEEAARLGFGAAVVPESTPDVAGIRLVRGGHVAEVLDAFELA